ncbi:MAG: hypothetical protein KKC68_01005 [Candidatus Thermoplasmatota archaeon]|nr:hypothetical protein [Candidatus Thermoplasmatota archaeon]
MKCRRCDKEIEVGTLTLGMKEGGNPKITSKFDNLCKECSEQLLKELLDNIL